MHQDTLNACLIADRKKNKGTSKLRERASAGFNIHLIEKVFPSSFPFFPFQLSCRQTEKVLNLWKQIKKRNCSIFLLITLLTLLPKELLLSCSSMISTKYSSSSTRAVFLLLHPLTWFFHVSFSHRGMGRTEVREPNLAHTPHEMPQPIKHSTEVCYFAQNFFYNFVQTTLKNSTRLPVQILYFSRVTSKLNYI